MVTSEERRREAFGATTDKAKQLITLASSILTVTITFRRDVAPEVSQDPSDVLLLVWITYATSIGFGVLTLLGLTGELGQSRHDPTLSHWTVRWPPRLQGLTFMLATTPIVWFGSRTLR